MIYVLLSQYELYSYPRFLEYWKVINKKVCYFATGNTPVCGWKFERDDNITVHVATRKQFQAFASELLDIPEEMFPR